VARAEAYLRAVFHLDLSNRLAIIPQSQTGQMDRTDNGLIAYGEQFYKWSPNRMTRSDEYGQKESKK